MTRPVEEMDAIGWWSLTQQAVCRGVGGKERRANAPNALSAER